MLAGTETEAVEQSYPVGDDQGVLRVGPPLAPVDPGRSVDCASRRIHHSRFAVLSWITNLSATTAVADPVRWARRRRRFEHDCRELEHGLGPDHFEGRTWRGRRHHGTP